MKDFVIEKGIPIPKPKPKKSKYPFNRMEIGDSFFHPLPKGDCIKLLQMKLTNASCSYVRRKGNGKKFKSAQLEKGIRIWRIK